MGFAFSRHVFSTEADLVDLHGEVAIVTGGNTGVGYGTVQWLIRKGAKVYIAGRSEERVLAAIRKLESEDLKPNSAGSVHFLKLDLVDPRLAKKAAQEFLTKETRLDILVNNAALGATGPFELTPDGLLDIMATNYIGHFVFTDTLLPLLKSTAKLPDSDVRIVNVTSIAHERVSPASFVGKDTLNKDYGITMSESIKTYGLSKLANILHIKFLQRQLDAQDIPITCIAVHPGTVASEGMASFCQRIPFLGKFISAFITPLVLLPWITGGMTSAFAAAGHAVRENVQKYKGAYLVPIGKIQEPSASARGERLARELEETTREVLKELRV